MFWLPAWLWPELLELELEPVFCAADVPLLELATVTGAFAFTGALAEAEGLTAAEPT